jgi:hypothetical protein
MQKVFGLWARLLPLMLAAPSATRAAPLSPYDMLPAKLHGLRLTSIEPHFMVIGAYGSGALTIKLIIIKDGGTPPDCKAGRREHLEKMKIAGHAACFCACYWKLHEQNELTWGYRDYTVTVDIEQPADFEVAKRVLRPAAEEAAAWIESLFRDGATLALQENRSAIAPVVAAKHAVVAKTYNDEPAVVDVRRQALEIQDPEHWYVRQ